MRLVFCCVIVAVMALAVYSTVVKDKYPAVEEQAAEVLFEVDGKSHGNVGERGAREHQSSSGYGAHSGHSHHVAAYGGYDG